jgi:hypothetical protein
VEVVWWKKSQKIIWHWPFQPEFIEKICLSSRNISELFIINNDPNLNVTLDSLFKSFSKNYKVRWLWENLANSWAFYLVAFLHTWSREF